MSLLSVTASCPSESPTPALSTQKSPWKIFYVSILFFYHYQKTHESYFGRIGTTQSLDGRRGEGWQSKRTSSFIVRNVRVRGNLNVNLGAGVNMIWICLENFWACNKLFCEYWLMIKFLRRKLEDEKLELFMTISHYFAIFCLVSLIYYEWMIF